jgi:hypothetical protein
VEEKVCVDSYFRSIQQPLEFTIDLYIDIGFGDHITRIAHKPLERLLATLPRFQEKLAVVDDQGIITREPLPLR